MTGGRIAVILINYNGYEDTCSAIKSLLGSSLQMTIIVIDNASANDEGVRLQQTYPSIVVLESKENLGFAGGNNVCIKYALAEAFEYIILLNNDTIIDSKMVEKLVDNADENTVTAPLMLYYNEPNTIWFGGGQINRRTGNAEHFLMGQVVPDNVKITDCTFLTGCCICVNRSIFEKVGLLNESYFMYCEDTEYCLRLYQAGIKMLMLPEAKLWHKVSSSTGGEQSPFSTYYMTRNRFYYIQKYRSFFTPYAMLFTWVSRYIRLYQDRLNGKENWKAYRKAMNDYREKITGKVESVI